MSGLFFFSLKPDDRHGASFSYAAVKIGATGRRLRRAAISWSDPTNANHRWTAARRSSIQRGGRGSGGGGRKSAVSKRPGRAPFAEGTNAVRARIRVGADVGAPESQQHFEMEERPQGAVVVRGRLTVGVGREDDAPGRRRRGRRVALERGAHVRMEIRRRRVRRGGRRERVEHGDAGAAGFGGRPRRASPRKPMRRRRPWRSTGDANGVPRRR